jgi:hypothetical protein
VVGTSTSYARQDHDHGLNALANGYGITGATGGTPTPAVSLSNVIENLGTSTALVASTVTNLLSASLAAGTYFVTCYARVQATAGSTSTLVDMWLATSASSTVGLGIATVVVGGTTAVTADNLSMSFSAIVSPGSTSTYYLNFNATAAVTIARSGSTPSGNTATGMIAIRIA